MGDLNFRTLTEKEIECRIATVKENGISLLLYKDARVDRNILDETVGAMDWERKHTRDNKNCIVSIWDKEKAQWVGKEDTGTESYTEKEKGLASDSFKRACFMWGIGRELYTAPFIWIGSDKCEIKCLGSKKYTCYDRFCVSQIGYDDDRNINSLVICNEKSKEIVFDMANKRQKVTPKAKETYKAPTTKDDSIHKELKRTGIDEKDFCKYWNTKSIDNMTDSKYKAALKSLKEKPDKTTVNKG